MGIRSFGKFATLIEKEFIRQEDLTPKTTYVVSASRIKPVPATRQSFPAAWHVKRKCNPDDTLFLTIPGAIGLLRARYLSKSQGKDSCHI